MGRALLDGYKPNKMEREGPKNRPDHVKSPKKPIASQTSLSLFDVSPLLLWVFLSKTDPNSNGASAKNTVMMTSELNTEPFKAMIVCIRTMKPLPK